MSSKAFFFPLAATGVAAFALVAAIFLSAGFARAGDRDAGAHSLCPSSDGNATRLKTAGEATFSDDKSALDEIDEFAALESVQLALTEVADGSTYVWHRSHGQLSGLVKPTSSFKDARGSVCRHAVVALSVTDETKSTEIVACRLPTGIWELQG
jgi:surface antigen